MCASAWLNYIVYLRILDLMVCDPNPNIPWIPDGGISVGQPWNTYPSPENGCCDVPRQNAPFNAQGSYYIFLTHTRRPSHTHARTNTHTRTHPHPRTHTHTRTHTRAHTHAHHPGGFVCVSRFTLPCDPHLR